jgi:hypothetical protein
VIGDAKRLGSDRKSGVYRYGILELKTNKRRELLSGAQRVQLLALPTGLREVEERYSFTPSDLEFIGAHRPIATGLG